MNKTDKKRGVLYKGRCSCCGNRQQWTAKEDRGYKWVSIVCMKCANDLVVMWRKDGAEE